MLGLGGLFALIGIQVAKAQAQDAADATALAAARSLPVVAGLGGGPTAREAAEQTARKARADLATVELSSGEATLATAVEVSLTMPGPMGFRVAARARAGVTAPPTSSGRLGIASGGGYSGPLVYRDGKPMCPAVAAAFDLMSSAATGAGIRLSVVSGFRSDAEQAELFRRHPDPRWVAPPGRSRHRDATELDLDVRSQAGTHPWLAANAPRFGFSQRYSWEPWHWGYLPGCGAHGGSAAVPGGVPAWVPSAYRAQVRQAATAHGIPPDVLAALLRAESGFNPRAVSPVGAQGIAQFMPGTAAAVGLRDPFDPGQAIPAAAALLSAHLREFGSLPLALAAYNAGPGAVARYGGIPPYRETEAYVARIMGLAGAAPGVALLRIDGAFV